MEAVDLKKYIIENDKIDDILVNLGCHKFKRSNGELRCALPNHNNPTSVSIKLDSLKVTVYSDDLSSKGDIFTFVMDIKDIKFYEAIKHIHQILGLEMEKYKKPTINKIDVLSVFTRARSIANACFQKFEDLEIFENMSEEYVFAPHIEWLRDGILPFAFERFKIGFDIKSNRILIPHRLWCGSENEYVGIVGRTIIKNYDLYGIPKYLALRPYTKSLNVYGLQENYKAIQKAGYVVVYEAEKSVLKRYSRLDETGVAICGHSLSREQAKILISLDVDIIIAMDKGIKQHEIRKICENFYNIRNVSYMYDKYDVLLKDKESPADVDSKKFLGLMETKIKYDSKEHNLFIKTENGEI